MRLEAPPLAGASFPMTQLRRRSHELSSIELIDTTDTQGREVPGLCVLIRTGGNQTPGRIFNIV